MSGTRIWDEWTLVERVILLLRSRRVYKSDMPLVILKASAFNILDNTSHRYYNCLSYTLLVMSKCKMNTSCPCYCLRILPVKVGHVGSNDILTSLDFIGFIAENNITEVYFFFREIPLFELDQKHF